MAVKIGYFLSSAEFGPRELVEQAKMARDAGFEALWISDHFHPWNEAQGQSGFVWGTIGALSEAVDLPIGAAVTCPTMRTHPAIIAQAAATAAVLTGGRFTLGVGTGEALNEYADAGYDQIYVNQIGPDQRGFFDFYAERILPQVKRAAVGAGEWSRA